MEYVLRNIFGGFCKEIYWRTIFIIVDFWRIFFWGFLIDFFGGSWILYRKIFLKEVFKIFLADHSECLLIFFSRSIWAIVVGFQEHLLLSDGDLIWNCGFSMKIFLEEIGVIIWAGIIWAVIAYFLKNFIWFFLRIIWP